MKPIKFKRVEMRKPTWDPHPEKSATNNSEWRKGLFVVFECNGEEFDWMPKWHEMSLVKQTEKQIEEINKQLAREAMS